MDPNAQLPQISPDKPQLPELGNGPMITGTGPNPTPVITDHADVRLPQSISVNSAMIADDADLIEKEWVDRAKAIVEHTSGDPHAQTEELARVKSDYITKRYNREFKVDPG